MGNDTIVELRRPEEIEDGLTELLRSGARRLIAEAVEAELAEFLEEFRDRKDEQGCRAVVRNGYLPKREIQTGIGTIAIIHSKQNNFQATNP